MPKSPSAAPFGPPRLAGAVPEVAAPTGASVTLGASPHAGVKALVDPEQTAYFEIYRAERMRLTSVLFSGDDWRWRFCSAAGQPIAVSAGYPNERACKAAVAAIRDEASLARVIDRDPF